jgi:hypothetical protein
MLLSSYQAKRCLRKPTGAIEYVIVDVTENSIQRPKKQHLYYSGKKKQHTIKTQSVIDGKSKKIRNCYLKIFLLYYS